MTIFKDEIVNNKAFELANLTFTKPWMLNSHEIISFVPTVGPRGPELNWNKFTISSEFGPLQEKLRCDMFRSIKIEKYMEHEYSGIFMSKVVGQKDIAWVPRDLFYVYES